MLSFVQSKDPWSLSIKNKNITIIVLGKSLIFDFLLFYRRSRHIWMHTGPLKTVVVWTIERDYGMNFTMRTMSTFYKYGLPIGLLMISSAPFHKF
jgi:hypothetical protein